MQLAGDPVLKIRETPQMSDLSKQPQSIEVLLLQSIHIQLVELTRLFREAFIRDEPEEPAGATMVHPTLQSSPCSGEDKKA
jgi:hypothetical protein